MVSGVQIDGNISHLVFRNITVTHVVNDGFALRTSPPGSKVRDILYQHIRTVEACDDGFSAHDDCEVRVEDFVADGCSTGIATSGISFNDRVVTRNIHGVDLLFGQGEHTVTNSRIGAHGGTAGISVDTWFETPGLDSCTLVLDNVVVTGPKGAPSGANHIQVRGAKGRLEIRHADLSDMSLSASGGAAIVLNDSVIRGNSLLHHLRPDRLLGGLRTVTYMATVSCKIEVITAIRRKTSRPTGMPPNRTSHRAPSTIQRTISKESSPTIPRKNRQPAPDLSRIP